MKNRSKYTSIICCLSVSVTLLLVIFALYYIRVKEDAAVASISATFAGITLTIALAMINYKHRSILIEHKLNDEHFVDRGEEYFLLSSLLKTSKERIFLVAGNFGMGKTYFAKMMCDCINFLDKHTWKKYVAFCHNYNAQQKIDHINFSGKHTWKKYVAFYCDYNGKQKIESAIASEFCEKQEATIADVSELLNSQRFNKKCVLFIDHIPEMQKNKAMEFAKAFIKCNKQNQVVIIIDANCSDAIINPSQFSKTEIKMLADSYGIIISEQVQTDINDISNGYPVYAHHIIKAYLSEKNISDCKDIIQYLAERLEGLGDLEKATFSLILCLSKTSRNSVLINDLMGIDRKITLPIIKSLEIHTFINCHKETLFVEELIKEKCYDLLSEYHTDSYQKLYNYYINMNRCEYIALAAALKSDISFDFEFVKTALKTEYEQSNFYLLILLGELDYNRRINSQIRRDKECLLYLRYYYLSALLETGYYNKAKEVVNSYSDYQDMKLSVADIKNSLDFEYQYLLIDLDHLTNQLEDATTFSCALAEKSSTEEQKNRCLYLYAHCIRHMGEDLNSAATIFEGISTNCGYTNDKIRIRSLYSIASIKLFEYDTAFNYNGIFQKIGHIIKANPNNEIWMPYVNRHKAIYEVKINNNWKKAKDILISTIKVLEKTTLRIKYDIYFELGDLFRISGYSQQDYDESYEYYEKALNFSKESGDFNLESSSYMGILLLNLKFSKSTNSSNLNDILKKSKEYKLNINYNSAVFIQHLLKGETVSQDLIKYWEKQQYSDLLRAAACNKTEQYNLKLTVM